MGGEERREVCQSAQTFYTPLPSGIHTTETSAGFELSKKTYMRHRDCRVRGNGECKDGNEE